MLTWTGTQIDTSEKQLLDCNGYGYSCSGGWYTGAYQYLVNRNGQNPPRGLALEQNYPYAAVQNACNNAAANTGTLVRVSGYTAASWGGSCNALRAALNSQPVAVAVWASNWGSYVSGTFNNCAFPSGFGVNHGVVVFGWNSWGKFWRIKNSWGTSWGMWGYMRLSGNPTQNCNNVCKYPFYSAVV